MPAGRPILVTGAHRSGTGWVGQMLASAPSPIAYLWEPFSPLHRPGTLRAPFPHWFTYVSSENEDAYRGPVADMLAFRYQTAAELRAVRSPKDALRLARDGARFVRWRREGARPLLKDPIALFSAGWLADRFATDVVVLIRHPAAFANSVIRRNLSHPFGDFLAQPLLMRDVLGPFEHPIRAFAAAEQPLLDQAVLLWNLVHHAVLRYRAERPDWTFRRLEDLAAEPQTAFEDLFARVGLAFDEDAIRTVAEHTSASNPAEVDDPAAVRRDSRASIATWKRRLSAEQVARIRAGVEEIASAFYGEEDW